MARSLALRSEFAEAGDRGRTGGRGREASERLAAIREETTSSRDNLLEAKRRR